MKSYCFKYRMYNLAAIALSTLVFSFTACTSARFDQVSFQKAYEEENYAVCLDMIKHKDYGKDSMPLKNLDEGILAHYAKNYADSAVSLGNGEQQLEAGDKSSVAQYESFYLNIFNALNYYHQNKIEDAVAEIKKADDEKIRAGRENSDPLWFIHDESANVALIRGFDEDSPENSSEYAKACEQFGLKDADLQEGTPRKPVPEDLYQGSPTAYYLGCIMRNANGDSEGARLSKDYLRVLNPSFPIDTILENGDGKAYLNILAFSGTIAQKEQKASYFPAEENGKPVFLDGISIPVEGGSVNIPPFRFKFPYLSAGENISSINRIEAVVVNQAAGTEETYPLMLLEDFGEHVKKNVALKARREYQANMAKSIIGKFTQAVGSAALIFAARKQVEQTDGFMKMTAQATLDGLESGLPALLEKSDDALTTDTRQAAYLPAKASAAAIALTPGMYSVKVRYLNDSITVREDSFDNVEVKETGLNLLEAVCLK